MEIERKFLLTKLPDIKPTLSARIFQGYLSTNPEVRIRSREVLYQNISEFILTVKGDGDLSREEVEIYISYEEFDKLSKLIDKPLIEKYYRVYNVDGHKLECSVVDPGKSSSFVYGEVEFETEEEANNYKWPFDGAEDVTYDKSYKMKNYWLRTRN